MSPKNPAEPPLTAETFAPYEGAAFRFAGWDGSLVLAAIRRPAIAGWPAHLRPPFSLIFHGLRQPVLPEATHRAQAPDGRQFHFHIQPIHTVAADRQDYQAAFN
jgi:hypothetical protein